MLHRMRCDLARLNSPEHTFGYSEPEVAMARIVEAVMALWNADD